MLEEFRNKGLTEQSIQRIIDFKKFIAEKKEEIKSDSLYKNHPNRLQRAYDRLDEDEADFIEELVSQRRRLEDGLSRQREALRNEIDGYNL